MSACFSYRSPLGSIRNTEWVRVVLSKQEGRALDCDHCRRPPPTLNPKVSQQTLNPKLFPESQTLNPKQILKSSKP